MASIEYVVKAVDDMSATLAKISKSVDGLRGNLDELGKKKASPAVELQDKAFAAKYDDVKARLDELSRRVASARADVDDKDANAKLAALQVKLTAIGKRVESPKIRIDGLDKAEAELLGLDASLDKVGSKAKDAGGSGGIGALIGAGGGGGGGGFGLMGLAWTAGVAVSPAIVTLGFGLGGLAAAAYGVVKPIETASQKTGGLAKNMHTLDPEQKAVAKSLLGLGKSYGAFQQALKPDILGAVNNGIKLSGHLMADVQPVAKATGKALNQVLNSVDQEFQSGTWRQFFGFMSSTAGPDLRLLGKNFTDLLNTLPPLLEQLQPVATDLLNISDAAIKLTGSAARVDKSLTSNGQHMNTLEHITGTLRDLLFSPGAGLNAALHLLHITSDGTSASQTHLAKATHTTGTQMVTLTTQTGRLGRETVTYTFRSQKAYTQTVQTTKALDDQAKKLNIVAAGYEKAMTPIENYIGAEITQAGDLHSLNQALQASHDKIGLKTQAERNSYSATQTYIQDTVKAGNAALADHQGIDAQIKSIENALPKLESVKGKTSAYRQELADLKTMLDKLRQEKLIQEQVRVNATGKWQVYGGTRPGATGGGAPGVPAAASGWMVSGGTPGRDSVLVNAMPGELIVPTKMVAAGLVDHLRGAIPGFAAGGIVPTYSGSPKGLPGWTSHNQKATITDLTASIAKSLASSLAAVGLPGSHGAIGGGVQRWAGLALQVLKMLGQPAGDLGTVLAQMTTESGGNPYAINLTDSNAAAGDPSRGLMQVIGSTFNAYAGPYAGRGIYDPLANIYAGLNYAIHRYGSSWTSVLGHGHGYAHGGVISEPIFGVGRSGRAYSFGEQGEETVIPGRSRGGVAIHNHFGPGAIREEADVAIMSQRMSFQIAAAGLASDR